MRWERMELNPHHGIQRQSLLRVLHSSHLSLTRSLKLFIVMCLTSLPDRYLCQLSSLVVQKLLGELSPVPRLQHSRMWTLKLSGHGEPGNEAMESLGMRLWRGWEITGSLVPRPSITVNVVEGLVNSYIEWRQVDVQKCGLPHHACTSIAVY